VVFLKSLLVCDIAPWLKFGGAMRINTIANILAEFGLVDLLLFPYPQTQAESSPFNRVCIIQQRIDVPSIDRFAATRESASVQLPAWLVNSSYDLIWYCRERSWLMARNLVSGPSVIDVDDLEDVILRQLISLGKDDQGESLSEERRNEMTRDIEWWCDVHRKAAEEADVLVYSSERDKNCHHTERAVVVPNTYETAAQSHSVRRVRPTILFQGLLGWWANEDAAVWLATEIAPKIRARVPELGIIFAGAPSDRVRKLASPMIEVTGQVPDMTPYLDLADLVVAPLRVGSGTRIKILEAFAHRVPVVSTSVGAAGLDVQSGVHLELSDTTEGLAEHCVRLLTTPVEAQRLTRSAYDLYRHRYRTVHARQAVHEAVRIARGR
jgi:glycosyltransferase involved in cell wall biosynthesis